MNREPEKLLYRKECPVCSSLSIAPLNKGTFPVSLLKKEQIKITDSSYGKRWDLSRCESCTHVFADPFPSQDLVRTLYSATEDPLYEEEAWGRSKNFAAILSFLEKLCPDKGLIFDVGAATGILLNMARERGWQTEGIEPSSWAVRVAGKKYSLPLQEGFFEMAQLEENRCSVVTMVDFIEHIADPLAAVAKAFSILAPGGILCLVTPDINSIAAKIAGKKWWHFRPAHLGFFSKKSLSILLQRSGFRVLKWRKYSWTFSAHYLLSRKPHLNFLLKNKYLSSFWKKIPIKLALGDSFEVYARKETGK